MVKVILTSHVITQLIFRDIDVHTVKQIAKKGQIVKSMEDGTIIKRGKSNEGRNIEVVINQKSNRLILETAYFL